MVSTRGGGGSSTPPSVSGSTSAPGPAPFSSGERVLCYEPDPTKAKVLYDSKVLRVVREAGRESPLYLIHFQGWNSSWDRCVPGDYVLKDTDENRALQRSLAEKSRLHLGAYLYRKERKKRDSHGSGSGSGRKDDPPADGRGTPSDDAAGSDSSGSGGSVGESRLSLSLSETSPSCGASIPLGPGLRERLTADRERIVKRDRLAKLPARPTVLEIIEGCVRARLNGILNRDSRPRRSKSVPPADPTEELEKLHVLREIADGLRIYFDFILGDQLLYPQEETQYRNARAESIAAASKLYSAGTNDDVPPTIKEEIDSESDASFRPKTEPNPDPIRLKAEPDPDPEEPLAKRLRSRKSPVAVPLQTPEPPESRSPVPPADSLRHSIDRDTDGKSSTSSAGAPSDVTKPTPEEELLTKAADWKLVPEDHPPSPSAVYGAIHFARLFVKLPDYLNVLVIPESKLKTILEYVDVFVQYLEEHEEWFGESCYCDSSSVS